LLEAKKIIHNVFEFLFENVYQLEPKATNEEALEAFIKNKLWGKLDQAVKLNHELALLRDYDTLIINGVEYPNLHRAMERIRANKQAWHDIATFRASIVHGDVTVDNILTSADDHDFKIIDPAPDGNEIAGPVFDFGRHYQSLGYGYEFLCRDNSRIEPIGNQIRYEDSLSAYYRDLREYFRDLAKDMLEPEEYRAMLFHAAVFYTRVLAHRVHINPGNVAKFYAVSVRAFSDFLKQYD
jgi:thiamine kinase-like enzyme